MRKTPPLPWYLALPLWLCMVTAVFLLVVGGVLLWVLATIVLFLATHGSRAWVSFRQRRSGPEYQPSQRLESFQS
jgi:uncharacterized membrane protein